MAILHQPRDAKPMADTASAAPPQRRRRPRTAYEFATMFLTFYAAISVLGFLFAAPEPALARASPKHELRNAIYLTGQHPLLPTDLPEFQYLTHIALAFMPSDVFNDEDGDARTEWPLFTTVAAVRAQVGPGTKLLVAVGGWGDTAGFERGARTAASRARFARNVAAMVAATGADGVDIDWEYPGGNGEDYKRVPNAERAWEIAAYPQLLAAIRTALGAGKIMSAAVPGKPEDMMAFTAATVPQILPSVDFLNVMAYDLMNRRDGVTKHHSGVQNSLVAVDAYLAAGCPAQRINLGLAFYVKYFKTEHEDCVERVENGQGPLGCRTLLLEDPETGADLGRTGGFSWHDAVPEAEAASFARAQSDGIYDEDGGGYYYWDADEDLWWTYDTADAITNHKFPRVIEARRLGGVFAWGLGEDGLEYRHFRAMGQAWKQLEGGQESGRDGRGEL